MHVLVTGATGLLGNNVVRALLGAGHEVRAFVRDEADRALAGLSVESVVGDIRDSSAVDAVVRGVDWVVHAAAVVHVGRRRVAEMREVNVNGTQHVVDACLANHVRLLHVSASDVVGAAPAGRQADEEQSVLPATRLPYVLTKREAEQHVLETAEQKQLHAVVVNPSFMLGPWDWQPSSGRMLLEVARGRGVFAPRGSFSLGDARDVAAGILAAIQQGAPGRRYLLSGATYTYLDAWRLMAEVTGGRRALCRVGPLFSALAGWGGDAIGLLPRLDPEVNTPAIRWAKHLKDYDCQRAIEELGYQPRPARETIEDAWRWFQENDYA